MVVKQGTSKRINTNKMITTKIVFDWRKRATRNEPGAVEIRVTIDRKTTYIGTGVRVLRSEWVAGAVCNRMDAQALNERVRVIYNKVMKELNAYLERGEQPDMEQIKKQVWELTNRQRDTSLLEWIGDQLPLLNLADGTLKHYVTLLTRLTEWQCMTSWNDVTAENIYKLDAWLHQLKAQNGGPISDGGVFTYHKCLKALLNRAKDFDRIAENPYDRLRGKFRRGDRESVEYLTEAEMKKFEKLKVAEGSNMARAKDIFIFQMFTGLSYSDAMAFDMSAYKWNGRAWVNNGERIKTGTPYVSRLLPPAVDVLKRNDWQVPAMDNADYNRCLKVLGEAAGIRTRLHSHLARHTFATWMLRNGAKIENVSRMLGHTNITQTQRYAKVLAQSVHDDFDMISEKLKPKK